MDLVALDTFRLVMELGSVTAAAERLNTVQPNVTARIRKLETEFGTALFLRANRRLTPTNQAYKLLDYAKSIAALSDAAKHSVSPNSSGDIRFGFVSTQAAKWLPPFIESYKDTYPEAEIIVDTGATESLVEQVLDCRMDAALAVESHALGQEPKGLVSTRLFPERLVVVAPPETKNLEEAYSHQLMVLRQEKGPGYRNFAHDLFQAMEQPLPKLMRISTLDGVLACIQAGLGYSVLPKSVLESRTLKNNLSVFYPDDLDVGVQIALIHRIELKADPRIKLLRKIFSTHNSAFNPSR